MIKQLSTKEVYKNNWMTVTEDQVQFPNGYTGIFGVVKKDDFALIIPFDGENFYLVKQYRYPISTYSWEFPQGKHEDTLSVKPLDLAKNELKEETGLSSENISEIGYLHEAPGYSNQGFHIFLAQELQAGEQQLEKTEVGLTVKKVTLVEFEEMVTKGEITDAPTLSAYGLLKLKKII